MSLASTQNAENRMGQEPCASSSGVNSLKACLLIAVTYFHFLIFAQFAFLDRLAAWTTNAFSLKAAMAAMAFGGVLFSLLTAGPGLRWSARLRIQASLALSALAAFASTAQLNLPCALVLSFLIGASLAVLTVTIASELRNWIGRDPWLKIGLGVGAGYWLANVPVVFTASSSAQAILSGILCLAACVLVPRITREFPVQLPYLSPRPVWMLISFLALVWLDSAAFYILQHVPQLKAGTWQGDVHLWSNGALHLAAALVSVWMLKRFHAAWTLGAAGLLLALACLLLRHPDQTIAASVFYPCGVSLYSVALVAFPSLLSGANSPSERARMAGLLYAIAGWMGSGLGIGMAEHLHQVPLLVIAIAGAVILLPVLLWILRVRTREALALLVISAISGVFLARSNGTALPQTAMERGRAVYISEGCIHCHSHYVRPGTADVLLWGPVRTIAQVHQEKPPLIGNRRQGPDLSMIGARRSTLWIKMHMIDPAAVSPGSIMPSYAMLFRDQRGDDLVVYLASLHASDPELSRQRAQWSPASEALARASSLRGQQCYQRLCAQCHSEQPTLLHAWKSSFSHAPEDYAAIPIVPNAFLPDVQTTVRLARLIKFGLPGTDMPGHEVLSDEEIASTALWLAPRVTSSALTHQPTVLARTSLPPATKE